MANPNRGEVELKTDDGRSFTLKLSSNKMLEIESILTNLSGLRWTRAVLHQALISTPAQKELTLEDAGDLIDDVGLAEVGALIEQTRWGSMATRARRKTGETETAERPQPASTGGSAA